MKTKITFLISCLTAGIFIMPDLQAMNRWQEDTISTDSIITEEKVVIITEEDSLPEVVVITDEDSLPTEVQHKEVTKRGDTTFVSLGNRKIRIIEQDGETTVKIQNRSESESDEEFEAEEDIVEDFLEEDEDLEEKAWKNFKGHWAGFEFGLNNYVDKDLSFNRNAENEFMDLNGGRSWNLNLNFAQYSIGFGTDRIGIVTGMGIEWNNYHFSDTNSIQKLDREITWKSIPDNTTKNRLQTTYLTVPLLIETQFFGKDRDDRFYLGAGIIGGLKLFSNTKIKYVENGEKQKDKIKDDYYLSPLRYGLTARAGYKAIKLYVNYYPTPLFLADRGPELYPVAAGLVVSF